MSCNSESASTPVSSASLARALSSDLSSPVSPGSTSFSRKSFPFRTRYGLDNLRAASITCLVFITCLVLKRWCWIDVREERLAGRGHGRDGHKSGSFRFESHLVYAGDDGKEEGRRPAAHQDAGERLDTSDHAPFVSKNHIAITRRRVGHCAEIEGRLQIRQAISPGIEKGPSRDLHEV